MQREFQYVKTEFLPPIPGKNDPKRDAGTNPVDCRMTKWSEWGPCSHTCGVSRRERYRAQDDAQTSFRLRLFGVRVHLGKA